MSNEAEDETVVVELPNKTADDGEQDAPDDAQSLAEDEPTAAEESLFCFTGLNLRPQPLDDAAMAPFVALGTHLGADVYVLLHGRGGGPEFLQSLTETVYEQFRIFRESLVGRRAVLVIDSPGGQASAAYKIARLFQQAAEDFVVAVPRYAMSAATLLSLGAREIHMGPDAQVGPLDVQLHDREREEWGSALDEVQALDQITGAAIAQADQAMFFLLQRSGKKLETLIPHALDFAAKLQAPMVDKIDAIHYSQQSRTLKVAEDYAERLLQQHTSAAKAQSIAQRLVHEYPEHGFVIDKLEASEFLEVSNDQEAEQWLDIIGGFIDAESPILFGKVGMGDMNGSEEVESDTDIEER